jgi:hypothetical protein
MRSWLKYVLIGLGVRLVLAPFFMHAWDIGTILEASRQFLSGEDVYGYVAERTHVLRQSTGLPLHYHGFAYLPQTLLIFAPFYRLYTLMFPFENALDLRAVEPVILYPQIYVFLLLIKMPIILADAAVIYLLSKREPRIGLFYALNPYVLFITAMWGNFDPLVGLFLLASYLCFNEQRILSGFLYGLSLIKIYPLVLLPFLTARSFSGWREFMKFLLGLSIASLPVISYLFVAPNSFLNAMLFQGTRPVNGMNVYYAVSSVQGMFFRTAITRVATFIFAIALLSLTYVVLRERQPMLNSVVMLMLAWMIFAPVTNEQYLASLMPLALLSQRFDKKLWIFPLLFTAFNATYAYFAMPIFWADAALRDLYAVIHGGWVEAVGPFSGYIRYFISLSFAFLSFRNVHSHFQPQVPALNKRFQATRTAPSAVTSGSPSLKIG